MDSIGNKVEKLIVLIRWFPWQKASKILQSMERWFEMERFLFALSLRSLWIEMGLSIKRFSVKKMLLYFFLLSVLIHLKQIKIAQYLHWPLK